MKRKISSNVYFWEKLYKKNNPSALYDSAEGAFVHTPVT